MNNNPKDAYYVFKSYWTTNPKFCYIESHTWKERNSGVNQKREVNVFSNCNEVELFINGTSQGKLKRDTKKFPASGLSWHVNFIEGDNQILAVGFEGDKKLTVDSLKIKYTTKKIGRPDNIILTKERLPDGNYLITANVLDKDGNHCPDFNKRVYFTALSGGKLLENLGSPNGSSVMEMANGTAQIIFKYIPFQKGVVELRTQDLKGTYITIEN